MILQNIFFRVPPRNKILGLRVSKWWTTSINFSAVCWQKKCANSGECLERISSRGKYRFIQSVCKVSVEKITYKEVCDLCSHCSCLIQVRLVLSEWRTADILEECLKQTETLCWQSVKLSTVQVLSDFQKINSSVGCPNELPKLHLEKSVQLGWFWVHLTVILHKTCSCIQKQNNGMITKMWAIFNSTRLLKWNADGGMLKKAAMHLASPNRNSNICTESYIVLAGT